LLGPDYQADADLLEEGVRSGQTLIKEVDEHGEVGSVSVTHGGKRPLLLVDGEQILGAKQNRIVNSSFVVFPGAPAAVPVSCVEQHRWRQETHTFSSSHSTITTRARAAKVRRVIGSVTTTGTYDANQSEVWRDVSTYLEQTHVGSPTSALEDGLRSRGVFVEQAIASIEPSPEQVGIAALLAGELLQLDVFGSRSLYRRGWRKIARGVLAEIHPYREGAESDPVSAVAYVLDVAARLEVGRRSAPGGGETLAGASHLLSLAAACHQGVVYHAVVVPN